MCAPTVPLLACTSTRYTMTPLSQTWFEGPRSVCTSTISAVVPARREYERSSPLQAPSIGDDRLLQGHWVVVGHRICEPSSQPQLPFHPPEVVRERSPVLLIGSSARDSRMTLRDRDD